MTPARIMLVDDHPLIREAIAHLVAAAPDFELIGAAGDGKECLARIDELRPDILILDIAMPHMNGEQVARELHCRYPALKIVALSGYTDRQFVRAMSKAGAKAYVVKSASGRDLIHALRAVASGKNYLSPEVTGAVMTLWEDSVSSDGLSQPNVLGKRERQVLQFIAEGYRSPVIAEKMGIAVATVEAHRRNILRKLQLHSAADLTRYALRHGIIAL
ncbi:MAG TPA: response regulator transcription factor [Steroidobacteraceae bacterium]|nr:response regulator transcription factor [Steroidobacteraceae bacterium]